VLCSPHGAEHTRELLARIVIDPEKMGGKPIVRGRRITVEMILGSYRAAREGRRVHFPLS